MAQTGEKDLYAVLGVARGASDAEIKKAYRKLAKELHPDLTGGDKAKSERFKEVSAAYDVLRDADKRRRYDAGEIDAEGQDRPQNPFYRSQAETDASGRYQYDGNFDDLGDFFSRAFRQNAGAGRSSGGWSGGGSPFGNHAMAGADVHFQMEISFVDAVLGATRRVTLPQTGTASAGSIDLHIPAGIEDGQTLRLAGKGEAGQNGGPAGDALVTLAVAPDPLFTRVGDDIHLELPISIDEAVLGASVEAPVPGGRVRLKVPANASSGQVLRLRSKGVARKGHPAGDFLVTLKIVLPKGGDAALSEAVAAWRAAHSYDPRANWKGTQS